MRRHNLIERNFILVSRRCVDASLRSSLVNNIYQEYLLNMHDGKVFAIACDRWRSRFMPFFGHLVARKLSATTVNNFKSQSTCSLATPARTPIQLDVKAQRKWKKKNCQIEMGDQNSSKAQCHARNDFPQSIPSMPTRLFFFPLHSELFDDLISYSEWLAVGSMARVEKSYENNSTKCFHRNTVHSIRKKWFPHSQQYLISVENLCANVSYPAKHEFFPLSLGRSHHLKCRCRGVQWTCDASGELYGVTELFAWWWLCALILMGKL